MEQSALLSIGLPVAVFIIMTGIGMTLVPADFQRVVMRPKALVWGIFAALVLLPLVAFALATVLRLPPEIAIGLVVAAACPIGTTSSLFSYLARGNVALAIALTAIGSVVTIATLPLYTNFAIDWFGSGDTRVHMPILPTIGMMLAVVLFPVFVGMGIRYRAPAFTAKAEKMVGAFGAIVLIAMIVGIFISVADRWREILASAGPAVVALSLSGIVLGFLGNRLLALSQADAMTVWMAITVRNAAVGMLLAITMIKSPEVAVPPALFGLVMYGAAFSLVAYGRRTLAPQVKPGASAPAPL